MRYGSRQVDLAESSLADEAVQPVGATGLGALGLGSLSHATYLPLIQAAVKPTAALRLDTPSRPAISGCTPSRPAVEDWVAELERGRFDAAWDLFLDRYRRLIFAAIRHYAQDYDDVMDVFARACEALRADDLRRLRSWVEQPEHRARFSTWLVTVVRHLTVDWFRHRDGRRRLSVVAEELPPLRRRIFELVFLDQRSHIEAYELIHTGEAAPLTFREFLSELRATYHAVATGRRGQILRDLAPTSEAVENLPADPAGPSATSAAEQSQLMERALGMLAPDDRLIVELYVLEELPAETVATVLGLANAKAVYNRAYRALAVVREHLERAGVGREDL
ncbi:MAG: hypothetical protein DMD40_08650 [Gemmatimonadetes bacterium]|nr:MAG: hypothetical protein DMD40_08650 [Gemmatimonadota bacterium]